MAWAYSLLKRRYPVPTNGVGEKHNSFFICIATSTDCDQLRAIKKRLEKKGKVTGVFLHESMFPDRFKTYAGEL